MNLPAITVVIVARAESTVLHETLERLRACHYPAERLEILLALGQQPSRQRNLAARAARGDILYFLDEDSQVSPGQLHRLATAFEDPAVLGICGPNLAMPPASPLAGAVDRVWTSFWGVGPKCARYTAIGPARPARDQDWIGCNLALRRQALQAVGGFDEDLWPDEEHELLERLQAGFGGRRFWYLPEASVRRPRPDSLGEYARTLLAYGEARMGRLRGRPSFWLGPSILPLLGGILLLVGLAAGCLSAPGLGRLQSVSGFCGGLYALWLSVGLLSACRKVPLRVALWCAVLLPLTHLLYAWGQWRGLWRRQRSSSFHSPGKYVQVLDCSPLRRR